MEWINKTLSLADFTKHLEKVVGQTNTNQANIYDIKK